MSIESTILQLRALINAHNIKYYTLSDPSVSDSTYDALKRRLRDLEVQYPQYDIPESPTHTVGSPVLTEGFSKIVRTRPMLSLQDVFDVDSINKLINSSPCSKGYVVEYKIDGLGVELVYINGVLTSASTRGDGLEGEDVTNNVLAVTEIPIKLPINIPRIEIRGEVYMRYDVFEDINKKKGAIGEKVYANTRNLASGSLKQLDPKVTAERKLSFFAYAIGDYEGYSFISQEMFLRDLKTWGFPISSYNLCSKDYNINELIEEVQKLRASLPYAIDGLVVKINDFEEQERLGYRSNTPKWAVAYKFPAEEVRTQIYDCIWQVGRTGILTPVAKVVAVAVGGVIVSSITLHNRLEIEREDVRIGDYVYIRRAGDVIPEIVRVDIENRRYDVKEIEIPDVCPECGSSVHYEETFIRCTNNDCSAKLLRKFIHYVARDAANIDGLSVQTLDQLINTSLLTKFVDLYNLNKEDLLKLDRFGERKADNLLEAVKTSQKNMTLPRFLYALGIPNVGETTALDLAKAFGTLEKINDAAINLDQLLMVENIGGIIADSISSYFINNYSMIFTLMSYFPHAAVYKNAENNISRELQGLSFLFTGYFDFNRKQAEKFITLKGGSVASSVTKNLSYLVVGINPKSKLEKAKKINIPTLTGDEFVKMVNYE